MPNSLDSGLRPPQRHAPIAGNLVIDNNNNYTDAPTKGLTRLAWGEGIALAGGQGNVVGKNLVVVLPSTSDHRGEDGACDLGHCQATG